MRSLGRFALAVAVITGWTLALIWLSFSVAQIAVERATTVSVKAHCLPAQDSQCSH